MKILSFSGSLQQLSVLVTLAALPTVASAQAPPTPPAATPGASASATSVRTANRLYQTATGSPFGQTVFVGEPVVANYFQNAPELQKKINLNIKETDPINAIRQVGKAAGIDVEVDKDVTSNRKIRLRGDDVAVQDALNALTNFGSIHWRYEKVNGKGQIRVSRSARVLTYNITNSLSPFDAREYTKGIQSMITNRLQTTQGVARVYTDLAFSGQAALPDTRVKIDVRDTDARDVLKEVMAQAKLAYALEDDVPTSKNNSFTFNNIPISMALDIITTSIGMGWRVEMPTTPRTTTGESGAPQPATPVVRIGKKYSRPRRPTLLYKYVNGAYTLTEITDPPAPAMPAPPPPTTPPATQP